MDRRESDLKFIKALSRTGGLRSESSPFREQLAGLFALEKVDLHVLGHVAVGSLRLQPRFDELVKDAELADLAGLQRKLTVSEYCESLDQPLFHRLLRRTVVRDLAIEHLLTKVRRLYLQWVDEGKLDGNPGQFRIMVSVAAQAFNNEYVQPCEAVEAEILERVRSRLMQQIAAEDGECLIERLVVSAMYAPLWTLGHDVRILSIQPLANRSDFVELVERQVREHMEEQRIRKEIRSFGVDEGGVATRVRRQYEESPYPRWIDVTVARSVPFAPAFTGRFPFLEPREIPSPIQILVAGCGTGHDAIRTATSFSDASVIAVDVSKASLAYAIRQARRYKLSNIEFLHGDLHYIERLGVQFDFIESAGVLHHLEDPLQGFRALTAVLKPGGLMMVAVYSRRDRLCLELTKRWLDSRPLDLTPRGLRALRQEILANHPEQVRTLVTCTEFFYLSGFRDLLCHVHEVAFTPAELRTFLQDSNVSFLGYEMDGKARRAYAEHFPDDAVILDLDKVDRFEAENLHLTSGLHRFWVRKNFSR